MAKNMPVIRSILRQHLVEMPSVIYEASGIVINGKRIKSLLFSTDVAIISNSNADAIIAVYPFTQHYKLLKRLLMFLNDRF